MGSGREAHAEDVVVRALGPQDAKELESLTVSVGWDDSDKDLKLLLEMPDQRSVGVFVAGQLVSSATITFFPKDAAEASRAAGWMSYVATRPEQQRRGYARRVCTEVVKWADATHPGASIGLFGEPGKAAPIYAKMGFADLAAAATWTLKVDPRRVLQRDSSAVRGTAPGTVQVNAKVRRITVGAASAEAIETPERFQQVVDADREILGGSREPALRTLFAQAPSLAWAVAGGDQRFKVNKIFETFRESRGTRVLTFDGYRDLLKATEGVEALPFEMEQQLLAMGSLDDGLTQEEFWEVYQKKGNCVDRDFAKIFGKEAGALATQEAGGVQAYALGRQDRNGGFYLGPVIASSEDALRALLVAAIRAASVRELDRGPGEAVQAVVKLVGVMDGAFPGGAKVLEELGFKKGFIDRFMVRGGDGGRGALYPGNGFSKLVAQNYEF